MFLLAGRTQSWADSIGFQEAAIRQRVLSVRHTGKPGMKPYLKGFHLLLETWRGGWDAEGWKTKPGKIKETETRAGGEWGEMEAIKLGLLSQADANEHPLATFQGPLLGHTGAAPSFEKDLEALLHLAGGSQPAVRRIRSRQTKMVVYEFGDASAAGFGATVDRPGQGLFGRFGIWGKDAKEGSSQTTGSSGNLVETVEEEAAEEY